MENITTDTIICILNDLDRSLKLQSIQVNYPHKDAISIFFTDKDGVFTHRVIEFPDQKMMDRQLIPVPTEFKPTPTPHWHDGSRRRDAPSPLR
jgi:hypothetical protein